LGNAYGVLLADGLFAGVPC